MAKRNCWEATDCGRGPGGAKTFELGVCPAATVSQLNGVHGGLNGGRACWGVVGTFCDGLVQQSLAQKLAYCVGCSFRRDVESEEDDLLTPQQLTARLSRPADKQSA